VNSQAFLDEQVCLPFIGGGETILRAFCSSALWQMLSDLVFPLQDAEMHIYNASGCKNHGAVLGEGDTHLPKVSRPNNK
jgi:hypothetical protein